MLLTRFLKHDTFIHFISVLNGLHIFDGIIFHVGWEGLFKCYPAAPFRATVILSGSCSTGAFSSSGHAFVAGNIYMYFLFWPLLTQAVIWEGGGTFFMWISAFVCHAFAIPAAFTSEHKATFQRRLTNYPQLPGRRLAFCVFCVPFW